MAKRGLTVARATETEIGQVRDLLNELSTFGKWYRGDDVIGS